MNASFFKSNYITLITFRLASVFFAQVLENEFAERANLTLNKHTVKMRFIIYGR